MIEIAADADFALDLLVVGGQVRIVDGPILAGALDRAALEIAMAEPPGDRVPGHGFAAYAAAALGVEAFNARPHRGDVPVGKIERHGVSVESRPGVDSWSAFDHGDIDAEARQVR